jgi:hypothetical protein
VIAAVLSLSASRTRVMKGLDPKKRNANVKTSASNTAIRSMSCSGRTIVWRSTDPIVRTSSSGRSLVDPNAVRSRAATVLRRDAIV